MDEETSKEIDLLYARLHSIKIELVALRQEIFDINALYSENQWRISDLHKRVGLLEQHSSDPTKNRELLCSLSDKVEQLSENIKCAYSCILLISVPVVLLLLWHLYSKLLGN